METERFIDGRCDIINSLQSGHGIKRRTNGNPYMSVSSRPKVTQGIKKPFCIVRPYLKSLKAAEQLFVLMTLK